MFRKACLICIAASLVLMSLMAFQAQAGMTSYDFAFIASGFMPSGAPVNPVTGSFTVTLDTDRIYSNETTGISLTSLNISLDSAIAFNYSPTFGYLELGGESNGINHVTEGTNDFVIVVLDPWTTTPDFEFFAYSQLGEATAYDTHNVAPVPQYQGDRGKYFQPPDITSSGVAVWTGTGQSLNHTVADDFLCKKTGPITGIQIWGAYLGDYMKENLDYLQFSLGIWSDVPANNQTNSYSHPGELLWTMDFDPGEYQKSLYAEVDPREFFMDPMEPAYLEPGDKEVWQFNFDIAPEEAFMQTEGNIYWLSVATINDYNFFGWKSTDPESGRYDAAVWRTGETDWYCLNYLSGENYPYVGQGMNMAFVITQDKYGYVPGFLRQREKFEDPPYYKGLYNAYNNLLDEENNGKGPKALSKSRAFQAAF